MQHLLPLQYEPILERALAEDIGSGDITANACVPAGHQTRATVLAKAGGVLAGLAVSCRAFSMVDNGVVWEPHATDGDAITDRQPLATITGSARALLTAERVALNVLQRMSGTATMTARFVEQVAGTRARIVDTRKTTPGLRILEKYAVRCGGGFNHRFGLYDCVLIKDNHIAAGGGIKETVARAREATGHTLKIEVECKSLVEVREALEVGADIILLDNMPLEMLAEGVALIGDRATSEASGGVNLSTVGAIARTGVHLISVGALTHSAPALDISLEFDGSL
ncbi:MAG: carboxylating nicotinate-nucleotide diphosphorylase [Armatimonadetes bacterium]|nr:carboxylating nicotinate-nucleotide diphosphorylase [Armatimonadota bacterium]